MSQQTNLLKNKSPHNFKKNKKTNKKRYKQEKLNQKQRAMYDKLERIWMKNKQENKELNEQRRHTKRVLTKSAREDWRKQKTATGIFIFF